MQRTSYSNYLPLLLSILFIGTSGPLGRLIHLPPGCIICIRSFIGLILLLVICRLQKISLHIPHKKQRNIILAGGLLLAAHWVAYFYALQLSTVALAMLSMFTYPIFTVLLEPFYLKKPFRAVQVPLALVALLGIYIMLPSLNLENKYTLGIIVGIGSAILFAARNLMVKKHGQGVHGNVLTAYQLFTVVIATLPFLFFTQMLFPIAKTDLGYLLFLGIATTALGHSAYVKSLELFSVSTVSLLSNFTPVVGIILGIFFLNEKPAGNILLGGSLILLTAVAEIWLSSPSASEPRSHVE